MLKNKSKILTIFIVMLLLFSTFCYATTETPTTTAVDETTESEEISTTEEGTVSSNLEYVTDDLYLFGDNVVMDKAVDGNAFIFGKNVEITGAVNGSLYVFGDVVNFKPASYVVKSIFVCANEVNFDARSEDLYAACNTLNMSYDAIIYRDLRVGCNTLNFASAVGRNAFVSCNNFNFVTEGEEVGLIYGNLSYSTGTELELSKEFVNGTVSYKPINTEKETETIQEIIIDKLIDLGSTLLFTLLIYFMIKFITSKFFEKSSSYISANTLAAAGIGAIAIILIPVICIVLLFTPVTLGISFFILTLYILSIILSMPIISVCVANKLIEKLKTNKYVNILILVLTIAVIWGLTQIPAIGTLISFIYAIVGLGIIFLHLFSKNKKEKNNEPEVVKN